MKHEITPEELIEMTVFVKENANSIHVVGLGAALNCYQTRAEECAGQNYFDSIPVVDEEGAPDASDQRSLVMAKNILECLDEAGFVIVQKPDQTPSEGIEG